MKKSDLKSGMIIETKADGVSNLGLLVESSLGLTVIFNDGFVNLKNFNTDLTHSKSEDFDIISVRQPRYQYQMLRNDLIDAHIIWERKEEVLEVGMIIKGINSLESLEVIQEAVTDCRIKLIENL